tara:strand:+ start:1410 stop:1919 length:510 start_codon:yes stop_codon:yes gene_type:complete
MKKSKRKIINKIREVTDYDYVDDPRRKKAPKNAKFKIVFYKPKPGEHSNIPIKFQGVQYYTNKSEADLALKYKLELIERLKLKKSKDMIGNNRNPNLKNIGVRFGKDNRYTINQKKEFNKKVKIAKKYLKSGHTKMETQRIINKKFKLNRNENSGTGRYVRVASDLLDK